VARPARTRAARTDCHSYTLKVNPAATCCNQRVEIIWSGQSAYRANEDQRWITLMEHVQIQVRYPVVSDRNLWQKWQRPRISCSDDDCIDTFNLATIHKMHRLLYNLSYRWFLLDTWMLECRVSKVQVRLVAHGHGVNWCLCCSYQINSGVSAGPAEELACGSPWSHSRTLH
jgi:hypothetical protein